MFIMPGLVWTFSGLVKSNKAAPQRMITMLVSPGHLHFCTESLRLFCSSKFAAEWAEVFFQLVFFPLKTKQVVVVCKVGIWLF